VAVSDRGAKKPLDSISSTWLGRTLRTAAAGGDVTKELVLGRLKRTFASEATRERLELAEREAIALALSEHLGRLKGLAMKLGQMLSYMDATLPPGARRILAQLQDSSTPMSERVIDEVLRRELGRERAAVFAEWDPTPIGVASIGQVHRARLRDGTEVAVKVQYPEIAKAFEADFSAIRGVGAMIAALVPGNDAAGIIDEVRARLAEECDYEHERKNIDAFRALFPDDPHVFIPRAIPEVSTGRVLVTEFVRGQRFAAFRDAATQAQKDAAGAAIYRAVYHAAWGHGVFNADPHPGNYLFVPTSSGGVRVALLDFGCVKRWSKASLDLQRTFANVALGGSLEAFRDVCRAAGVVRREEGLDFATYRETFFALMRPILFDEPFTFSNDFLRWMNGEVLEKSDFLRLRLPPDLTMVNRVWWGLYNILADLGATFNAHRIAVPVVFPEAAGFSMPTVDRRTVRF
jgi:predicted unusual protein kinase regulating ubiquinone biosynthesis (AarF/ABC1/UbiB family)